MKVEKQVNLLIEMSFSSEEVETLFKAVIFFFNEDGCFKIHEFSHMLTQLHLFSILILENTPNILVVLVYLFINLQLKFLPNTQGYETHSVGKCGIKSKNFFA